jgi:hypothetical protein
MTTKKNHQIDLKMWSGKISTKPEGIKIPKPPLPPTT